jgi:hypothetical protein
MNPFDRYFTPEDNLHRACCQWMDLQYPKILYTHAANESRRTKFERYKASQLRMKAGVPDLLIFEPNGQYAGLSIEFKIKPNKCTSEQNNWLEGLKSRGWQTEVVYTIEQFIEVVNNYMKLKQVA